MGSSIDALEAFPPASTDELLALAERPLSDTQQFEERGVDAAAADGNREESDGERPDPRTITYRGADGAVRAADVGAAPFASDGHGERTLTLFVLRDVTERVDRARTLERERDRLDDFADMLAHELRNPLNVAQAYLGQLAPADGEEPTAVDRIETAHDRLEEMIDELLAHARDAAGSGAEPVALGPAARTAWETTATGSATLDLAVGTATVEATSATLETVFENLFRNARDHAGDDVEVRVGILPRGGFYVEDDGTGIPPSERGRVFESGYTTEADGTGLGLALVAQVAETYGWSVAVADSERGGARFEFRTDGERGAPGARPDVGD